MKKTVSCACLAMLVCAGHVSADTFIFGRRANGLTGLSSGTVAGNETTLSIAVATPGAVMDESDSDGMGIDATTVAGVTDASDTKFNMLTGSITGGEAVTFSFDQPGILNSLLFDGMKDESLENFILTTPDGTIYTLFDFEVEMRLNHQGFQLSDMGVTNPTQALDSSDDIVGLNIPYQAGEVFTLTYGEVDYDGAVLPGYYPADNNLNPTGDTPNGIRFEGIVVTVVPEPATLALGLIAMGGCMIRRR